MSECTHDCSSCSQNCSERKDLKEKQNENNAPDIFAENKAFLESLEKKNQEKL